MKLKISLILLLVSFHSMAETLVLEYSTFYSHVRKIDNEDTASLQFAFGFLNVRSKQLCEIRQAFINTQKQDIPLTVTPEQRFTVPAEKALKMAKAKVVVELVEAGNLCDMSVQLETKPEFLKAQYSGDQVRSLYQNYQAFFDNMGGLLSFLMPEPKGLLLQFDKQLDLAVLPTGFDISDHQLRLTEKQIETLESLPLTVQPLRVTAWMDN